MKRTRFTEEQIIGFLKQVVALQDDLIEENQKQCVKFA